MARTLSQNTLNNNMSGVTANTLYQATHGGSLGGATGVVTGVKPSGNYTTNNGGNVTYHFAGDTAYSDPVYNHDNDTNNGGGNGGSSRAASNDDGGGYGGGYGAESYAIGGGGGGYDYASMIAEMLAAQRAAAEQAYERSMYNLNKAWNDTTAALSKNLNSSLDTMKKNYEYGQGIQNDDAAKSLREAYVNYMMNKRNLNQNLSAAGVSGGATESSLANLFNNYGTSRNNINTTLAKNLAQLLNTYENNVAAANQLYNSQYAEAANNRMAQFNQLEQMLAGNLMSNYSGGSLSSLANYAKTLADLTGNMESAMTVFTPTQNTLGIDNYNTIQGNNMGTITDYAKYLEMLERMGQGA